MAHPSRIGKDSKEARDRKIFEMWMATIEEIGEAVHLTRQGVGQVLKDAAELPEVSKPHPKHFKMRFESGNGD